MIRKRVQWKFRDSSVTIGERTLIVGILNVTPDSFSDGGSYSDPNEAVKRALEMQDEGADILDIGAESTKPGSEPVSEAEELRRLVPVLKRLKGKLDIPISVDTYKPAVAEAALEHGASIINDVSGLVWEPDLAKTVLHSGAGLILNHTRGKPEEWARQAPMRDVMGEIAAELEASVHRASKAGIEMDHIVIDPGIGFGKRKEQNSELIARLGELRRLPLPILIGPSRKHFLAQEDPRALEFATAGAVAASILNGASLVRVHDVAAIKAVVATVDAIVAAIPEAEEEKPRKSAREATRERTREEAERKKPVRPPLIGGPKKAEPPVPPLDPTHGERPVRPKSDDERREADPGERRPSFRGKREDDGGERRPPFRGKRDDDRGERRPPFASKREDDRGERRPSFRGKREDDGGERRPPFRGKREDDGGERRPPFRGKREDDGGERRPPFRGKREDDGGERRPPFRGQRDDDRRDRRPSFGSKRADDRGERRPPFRGKRDDDGRRPAFGAKRGEDRGEHRPPPRGKGEDDRGPRRPPSGAKREDDRGERRPPFRGKSDAEKADQRRPFRPRRDDDRGGRPSSGGPKRPGGPKGGGRGPSTPRRRG